MSYEVTMHMPDRIQMRLGRVHDQMGDVHDLMSQNRWALAHDPHLFREYLGRIQTVLTNMYAQIPQNAPQRVNVAAERRPAAPRRHDHLAAERTLNADDTYDRLTALMRAAIEDAPLERAQLLHPRIPIVDDDRDMAFGSIIQHRSRKRSREGFRKKYRDMH